jgi:NAD(P)-dependent dehydrogenase (short-subunit alcohol dehydrogenase family)
VHEVNVSIEDKHVVITGAAGDLGGVVARQFAQAGAKLALIDNRPDRLGNLFRDLQEEQGALLIGNTDITIPASVGKMVDLIMKEWDQIDILLNIAGGYRAGNPLHETTPETWDFMMNLNAKSVFLVAGAVVPHMIERGAGKIVNVAAHPGLKGSKGNSAYSASKSAVIRLTETLSAELKAHNINVNCIIPRSIDTPSNREAMPNADFSKWVAPEQIADVMQFLCSEAASAITGAAIPVYGLG